MRIVSLLPAATDVVVSLGLRDALVGRTHECDWPPGELEDVPVVTSTALDVDRLSSREISAAVGGAAHAGSSLYGLDADALAALAPDLVLTQELCDVCALSYDRVSETVRRLQGGPGRGPQVVSLEPHTYAEVLDTVLAVGRLTGREDAARSLLDDAARRLDAVRAAVAGRHPVRVVAIEWLDPLWPAGHWVPEQIAHAGGVDLLTAPGTHTSPMQWDAVLDAAPDVVLLLPCGLPMERTLAEAPLLTSLPGWADLPAIRAGQVWVLDGPAYFNRPGPRVVRGVEVLAHVLHGVTPPGAAPVLPTEARPLPS
ncbi:MAG: ABC transporter substrate-binding protein [Motilibacteraceae bacterium]